MLTSFLGEILFLFNTYSKAISGTPPGLPPIMSLPFKSDHLKFSSFSLATRKEPSLFVSCENKTG